MTIAWDVQMTLRGKTGNIEVNGQVTLGGQTDDFMGDRHVTLGDEQMTLGGMDR